MQDTERKKIYNTFMTKKLFLFLSLILIIIAGTIFYLYLNIQSRQPMQCIIKNSTIPNNSSNPENSCQYCNPKLNKKNWSNKESGQHCGEFGRCDGKGTCFKEIPVKNTSRPEVITPLSGASE